MTRRHISTGTPWEAIAGYSRAVQVGSLIYVSGTTAVDTTGQILHVDDAYEQMVYVLKKIEAALKQLDSSLQDVVRTRVYVTNMDDIEQVTKAHCEFFGKIRPANTLVEVSRLATPEMLVEVEVDAVVQEQG
ncbi:RidA family protein [Leptolyngbya sp. FACHB-541]|uniref:RidA family protein n=1 Tax=Leptolyngbya sp. FACHB-541 TaxID=2692810 RepID=UPI001689E058|nr:RidA family protein [Leptolyngbya sp. FACHB-541]MBD1996553.1 RidA family protein [Leptolyngbya sp. FACHB-541]